MKLRSCGCHMTDVAMQRYTTYNVKISRTGWKASFSARPANICIWWVTGMYVPLNLAIMITLVIQPPRHYGYPGTVPKYFHNSKVCDTLLFRSILFSMPFRQMGHSCMRSPHIWQVPWPHRKIMFLRRSMQTGQQVWGERQLTHVRHGRLSLRYSTQRYYATTTTKFKIWPRINITRHILYKDRSPDSQFYMDFAQWTRCYNTRLTS